MTRTTSQCWQIVPPDEEYDRCSPSEAAAREHIASLIEDGYEDHADADVKIRPYLCVAVQCDHCGESLPDDGGAVGNVFAGEDNMTATIDRVGVERDLLAELKRLTEPFGLAVDNVFLRSVEPDAKTAQSWERMATKAIEAGVSLYTAPCGSATPVAAGTR
jgi:hypothetical protein